MKGGGGLMDVDQSIQPILPFFNGVEDRYAQGWNRFAVVTNVAAVAAAFPRSRMRNTAGSNVVIVVEHLIYFSAADQPIVTWGATTTDLTNLAVLSFTRMDPRGNPTPTAIVSFISQAAGGQPLLQKSILAGTSCDFILNPDQQIPILPGQAVDVQGNVANTQAIVSWMWRERAMEASELT